MSLATLLYPFRRRFPRPREGPNAFTLIELLIVVAIISILAAIAVPNYLGAQTRAKTARIKNDQRTLATGLESYRVDNNKYPKRTKAPDSGVLGTGNVELRAQELSVLTTPISYLTSIPVDVFENRFPGNNQIDYLSPPIVEHLRDIAGARSNSFFYSDERDSNSMYEFGWGLSSVGPDGRFGFRSNVSGLMNESESFNHWQFEYDPTNGTVSKGNIFRFHRSGATATDAFQR